MSRDKIITVKPMGFPWETQDPFLFCAYHRDEYPTMFPLPERGGVVPGTTPVQQAWRVYGHTDTGWSLSTHPGRAP